MYRYLLTAKKHVIDRVLRRDLGEQPIVENMVRDTLTEQRRMLRIKNLRDYQHNRLWSELIAHLKYERTNAKIGREYKSSHPSAERDAAFDAYLLVLDKQLVELETLARQRKDTPSRTAKKMPRPVPNNGSHWTDWVPQHVKRRVTGMFESMPVAPRTKRKIPFQRTIRPEKKNTASVHSKAVFRLKQRTTKELHIAISETMIFTNSALHQDRVRMIKQALRWIAELKHTDFVPATWHGFYPDYKERVAAAKKREQ
jgi:hypothetical protein